MQEVKTTSTLYIPDNIKTGFEFVSGFGWSEMAYSAIVVGIAIILAIIWSAITSSEYAFMHNIVIVVVPAAAAFGIFKKDNTNQSMLDHGRRFITFSKQQQKFKYRYHNPFDVSNPGN